MASKSGMKETRTTQVYRRASEPSSPSEPPRDADSTARQRTHESPKGSSWQARDRQLLKKIAIVDDEKDLCMILSILVRKLGHQVEFIAHTGREIIAAILEERADPDLVLMDYRMPVMNGVEASQRILRLRPWIRIVVISGDDSTRQAVTAAGLVFLQKPFSISTLAKTIEGL